MAERCRYCKRPIRRTDAQHARYWPFCSERCKMAELGHWFEGRYVIGRPVDQVADDAALKAPAPPKEKPGGAPRVSGTGGSPRGLPRVPARRDQRPASGPANPLPQNAGPPKPGGGANSS
jgi:endogenous inhibitor of DNA gyrase (YacG/DUF329 family)